MEKKSARSINFQLLAVTLAGVALFAATLTAVSAFFINSLFNELYGDKLDGFLLLSLTIAVAVAALATAATLVILRKSIINPVKILTEVSEETEKGNEYVEIPDVIRLYFDNIPTSVAVLDPEYDIVFVNKNFKNMFSRFSAKKFYRRLLDVPDGDYHDLKKQFSELMRSGEYHCLRWEEIDNEKRCFSVMCSSIALSENKNGAVVVIVDSTELARAKDEALSASKAKSEFLSRVSHELRTPLNAIIGLSEVELRNDLDYDTRENIEKIYRSGSILLSLINDILDISKMESGNFEIIQGNYDFPNMVSDTIHLNIVRLTSKPVAFEPQIDESIPVKLRGDELRIKQVLNNLLSNAFKYTDEGKVVLKISCERMGSEVMLSFVVSDTGRGITKANLEKLFSEYQQFDAQANRKIESTGLGLAISKKLVDMMGGTIEAESEYGKGSVFTVRLTQGIVDYTPIGVDIARNLRTFRMSDSRHDKDIVRVPIPDGKVLIVDDIVTNLDVAKGLMSPYALTIHCASGGAQAVEIIKEGKIKYDAVFMDYMMPEMDGVEAVRVIREEIGTEYAKTVPIVALTANAILGNEKMFLEKGFQAFLSKPVDIVKLDEILNKWVRRGPPPRHSASESKSSITKHLIEGIDLVDGVSRFGKEESYLQIIKSYVTHAPALLEKLENAATLSDYITTIHGLKGASYGMCAFGVGKMAEELEFAAKRGDVETVKSGTDAFIKAVDSLISQLSALVAPPPS